MKDLAVNKKIVWWVLAALVVGGLIGWLIKPSSGESPDRIAEHGHGEDESQVWTCSMHPQIRMDEPGQCPICGMDLIPANAAQRTTSLGAMVHEMTPEAVALANIQTTTVASLQPEKEVTLTGKIKADEQRLATITAKFPGRVEKLFVNFTGQQVRKGERLASVYSPELLTAQKELIEASKTKESYPELYQAAQQKLRLWKVTDEQISRIESAGKVTETFDVYAERAGIVIGRNVSVGDYVSTGTVLFEITDLSKVWVMLDAYESDLEWLEVGNPVTFKVAAIPGAEMEATIAYIDPIVNPQTRTVTIRAEADNRGLRLKPDMFVTAKVTSAAGNEKQVVIPRTALLWSGKRSVVYVKVPDVDFPAYEMREIALGARLGETYIVEAGLDAGEEIVSNGAFSVDAAAQLAGNFSMMMRPETRTIDVTPEFRMQITALADAYIGLKNSLVDSDPAASQKNIGSLNKALSSVDVRNIKDKARATWEPLRDSIAGQLSLLKNESDLENQRKYFVDLSEYILQMTESFGLANDKMYKAYCPMAIGNKGAFWLSEVEEIRNPYFGESMLACGEVKETYRKDVMVRNGPAVPQTAEHRH